jgi:small subunit ribosomal protein S16
MVKIRLRRTGKTKQPSYRLVVADSRSPRDGKFIEIIGHYEPVRQPKIIHIKADRARYWLSVGAQPSEAVVNLFKREHILDSDGNIIPPSVEDEDGVEIVSAEEDTEEEAVSSTVTEASI